MPNLTLAPKRRISPKWTEEKLFVKLMPKIEGEILIEQIHKSYRKKNEIEIKEEKRSKSTMKERDLKEFK